MEHNNIDLEKAIQEYFDDRQLWDSQSQPSMEEIARHFYKLGMKWQKEQQPSLPSNLEEAAKEYLRQYNESEFGNGGDDWDDDIFITFKAGAQWRDAQIPKLPESLDKAAIQAHIRLEDGEGLSFLNIFKAGAEWMAGQGVSVDASVVSYDDGLGLNMSDEDILSGIFKDGDKVIVQIRKK